MSTAMMATITVAVILFAIFLVMARVCYFFIGNVSSMFACFDGAETEDTGDYEMHGIGDTYTACYEGGEEDE